MQETGVNMSQQLSQEIYRQMRDGIVRGEIRPNERLVEADLAERLNVSRTPIREGLQRLASEGLIVSRRRGWAVREHDADEIREIYETRIALEGYAARLAAERATDDELDALRQLNEEADSSPSARVQLVEYNDALHEAVCAAARNATLTEMVRRCRKHVFNYRLADQYSESEAEASLAGHDEIIDALLRRDGAAAEDAMRRHVAEALTSALARHH